MKPAPKFKHRIIYVCFRLSLFVAIVLPRPLRLKLFYLFGYIVFDLLKREKERILTSLGIILPETTLAEQRKEGRACLGHFSMCAIELALLSKDFIENVDFKEADIEKINDIMSRGKGVIMLSPHFGNWELLPQFLSVKGFSVSSVAKRLKIGLFQDYLEKKRVSLGAQLIYRSENVRNTIKALRRNEIVGMLPDQDIKDIEGVFIKFFGKEAKTPVGPVQMAALSGAPLLPVFCIREGLRYRIIVEDPIFVEKGARSGEQMVSYTRQWTDIFEKYISRYPNQWALMHCRWKTQDKN